MTNFFSLTAADSVKITDGTNTASINTDGSLTNMDDGKINNTISTFRWYNSAGALLGTVPVDKKWIVISAGASPQGANDGYLLIQNSGSTNIASIVTCNAAGNTGAHSKCYYELVAGEKLYSKGSGVVSYIEVDA